MVRGVAEGLHDQRVGRFELGQGRFSRVGAFINQHDGQARVLRVLNHRLIGVIEAGHMEHRDSGLVHSFHHSRFGGDGLGDLFPAARVGIHIHLCFRGQGQDAVVLVDDGGVDHQFFFHGDDLGTADGVDLLVGHGDVQGGGVLGRADQGHCLVPVAEGILKDAQMELVLHDAQHMHVQGFLSVLSGLDFSQHHVGEEDHAAAFFFIIRAGDFRAAGEHIDAHVQDQHIALAQRQGGNVDTVAGDAGPLHDGGRRQRPVGADHAVIAQFIPQDGVGILVHIPLEAGRDADVVVGHHKFGPGVHNGLPADLPGIDQIRGRLGVGVAVPAAAGDEVLGMRIEAVVLIGAGFNGGHGRDVIGVIAVPGADLIAVAMEHLMVADRHGLFGVFAHQFIEQILVPRHAEGIVRRVDHAAPGIVGAVAGEHHRNAQLRIFRKGLDFVQHIQLILGRTGHGGDHGGFIHHLDLIGHGRVIGAVHGDEGIGFVRHLLGIGEHERRARCARGGVVGRKVRDRDAVLAADAAKAQGAGFHLQRHPGQQVSGALVSAQTPVFIGIQLAAAVQILEPQAVCLEEFVGACGAQPGLIPVGLDVVETGGTFPDHAFLSQHGRKDRGHQHDCNDHQ